MSHTRVVRQWGELSLANPIRLDEQRERQLLALGDVTRILGLDPMRGLPPGDTLGVAGTRTDTLFRVQFPPVETDLSQVDASLVFKNPHLGQARST